MLLMYGHSARRGTVRQCNHSSRDSLFSATMPVLSGGSTHLESERVDGIYVVHRRMAQCLHAVDRGHLSEERKYIIEHTFSPPQSP